MSHPLLTTEEAAAYLAMSPRTLERWRVEPPTHGAPKYVKVHARCVRYHRDDLDAWIAERRFSHTSEEAEAAQ